VSYDYKHNEANGEDNRDGDNNNLSWNSGAEGPTDDRGVVSLRERRKRNFVATLFLSQGVPMLCAGDEMGRTQRGNNNAYCQDNEISWLDWELSSAEREFLSFVRRMAAIWKDHPVFQRRKFFQGRAIRGSEVKDVSWLSPSGEELSDSDWGSFVRCIGMRLAGDRIDEVDERGVRIEGATVLVLFNAHHEPLPFTLPRRKPGHVWQRIFDTARPEEVDDGAPSPYPLADRSVALFRTRFEGNPVSMSSERSEKPTARRRDAP
jgi:glycogen operon protein